MKRTIKYIIFFIISICIICLFFNYTNKKETVAIIGAMDDEINEIHNNLNNTKTVQQNDFKIITGKLGKYNIVLTKSGVGKVASAVTTQFIIDKYSPVCIINTGIAGSLSDNLKAGDIIIAKDMVQHDFDVTAFGSPKGYIDNGIEPNKPTLFHSDKTLIEKFKNKFNSNRDYNVMIGTIATGDVFANKEEQKNQIRNEFNADAIDMESAAIAQTTQKNNIPVIVLRTISDSENDSTSEYKQNKKSSAQKAALYILSVLE